MSVVRRISIGALLPAATLTSLFATTATAPSPAAERRPEIDPARSADPCQNSWATAPTLKRDVDRLMDFWSKPNGSTRAQRASKRLGRPEPVADKPKSKPSQDRPNVIVFMVDDMRADEMNGPWMRQTRDLIQSQGATFTNSFSPLPLCGPARASFFTGKYAHNTGIRTNMTPSSAFNRLDDGHAMPVWLKNAGYNTAFLGKYINGYAPRSANKPGSYVPPGWDNWYASIDAGTYNYRRTILSNNGKGTINLGGKYQTTEYGKMGSNLVSKLAKKKQPFFFNLSFTAPHTGTPVEADDPRFKTPVRLPKMRGAYDDLITTPGGVPGEPCNDDQPKAVSDKKPIKPGKQRDITEVRRQRAESLASVDDAVARVMRSLRKSGELDNTYVVFTSDNGYFLGEFRQPIGKKLQYEPSLRTPTIMRGPGIDEGIKRERAFTTIDFAPTVADMAGAKTNTNVDGISLLDVATGEDKPWRRPIVTDAGSHKNTSRYGFGLRTKGLFYGEYADRHTSRELFDLERDPRELRNVAGKPRYRKTARTMADLLDRFRNCSGEQCQKPSDVQPPSHGSDADGGGT